MWAGSVLLMIINVIKLPWPIFGTVQALDPLPYHSEFLYTCAPLGENFQMEKQHNAYMKHCILQLKIIATINIKYG